MVSSSVAFVDNGLVLASALPSVLSVAGKFDFTKNAASQLGLLQNLILLKKREVLCLFSQHKEALYRHYIFGSVSDLSGLTPLSSRIRFAKSWCSANGFMETWKLCNVRSAQFSIGCSSTRRRRRSSNVAAR